jgi:hypothetical protein
MTADEVNYLVDAVYEEYKERMELHRSLVHSIIAVNSTKKLKPTDIMKFDWDNKRKSEEIDIAAVKARIMKKFNINHN